MKALVTGASSGIGRDIARALVCRGWDVILVARRADRLLELKKELGKHASCVRCDVSHYDECVKLHEVLQNQDIEMLVNCLTCILLQDHKSGVTTLFKRILCDKLLGQVEVIIRCT